LTLPGYVHEVLAETRLHRHGRPWRTRLCCSQKALNTDPYPLPEGMKRELRPLKQ
jgi:hypothetical protein